MRRIVDIIYKLGVKSSDDDMNLRIVQTAYSLIEPGLLQNGDYSLVTHLY